MKPSSIASSASLHVRPFPALAAWCARPLTGARYAAAICATAYLTAPLVSQEGPWVWLAVPLAAALPLTARRLSALGLRRRLSLLLVVPPLAPFLAAFLIVGGRGRLSPKLIRALALATSGAFVIALLGTAVGVILGVNAEFMLVLPTLMSLAGTLILGGSGYPTARNSARLLAVSFGTLTLGMVLAFMEGTFYWIPMGAIAAFLAMPGAIIGYAVVRLRSRRSRVSS